MPGTVTCSFTEAPTGNITMATNQGTVHIYYGETAALLALYEPGLALLTDTEKQRAAKYHFIADRQRYVIQHSILQVLLGRYLHSGDVINYTYGLNKKPYLAGYYGKHCYFNLSHSAGHFLIAISNAEIGIDIEKINQDLKFQDIASQWFSTAEVEFINRSAEAAQAFFLLWTRKEALLKACGSGIDDNLPLMPSLNGKHMLPTGYADIDWHTTSFKLNNDLMASVTSPLAYAKIELQYLHDKLF